jgi:hypothetical protein
MACKPPVCRQLRPPHRFPPPARGCCRACGGTCAHERGPAAPGTFWPAAVELSGCSACSAPERRCRRNAVGLVGVKLGAAPDAPQWGEVLVRTPSGRFSGARWRATSKFTCLSRELPACPAEATRTGGVKPGGAEPRSRWPASSGGGGRGGRKACWPEAGLRIARHPAWAAHQANAAANAAKGTRQRASVGRACGQGPHPGKDPL